MAAWSHSDLARLEKRPFPPAYGDLACVDGVPENRLGQRDFTFGQLPFSAYRAKIRCRVAMIGIEVKPAHA